VVLIAWWGMELSLSPEDVDALFALADLGVRAGFGGQPGPQVDPEALLPALRVPQGAFVTLEVDGELNGCIGSIVAVDPLGVAVPQLAWKAAFADPRLPALTPAEYPSAEIKISVLSPLEPVPAGSEAELLSHLEVGRDGVLIRSGAANATFLPAMWAKMPDPVTFLRHLEAKAGLRPGSWPSHMEAWRYRSTDYRRRAVDIDRRSAA
jgi:AmmeMemoRadiSam system protein A